MESKLSASDRRILTTKWVAKAWARIKQNQDMIVRYFVKCGMSNNVDGSEDHLVNIRGLEDYQMPKPESEFHLLSDSDDDDDSDGDEYCENDGDAPKMMGMHRMKVILHLMKKIALMRTKNFVFPLTVSLGPCISASMDKRTIR